MLSFPKSEWLHFNFHHVRSSYQKNNAYLGFTLILLYVAIVIAWGPILFFDFRIDAWWLFNNVLSISLKVLWKSIYAKPIAWHLKEGCLIEILMRNLYIKLILWVDGLYKTLSSFHGSKSSFIRTFLLPGICFASN